MVGQAGGFVADDRRRDASRSGRIFLVGTIALLTVIGAAELVHGVSRQPVAQRVDPEENEATRLTASGLCGVERWAMKTLTDPAAGSVNLVAKRATVAGLNALPAPTLPADNTTRLPTERQAYRVTAILVKYKLESDQDIHLILAGGGKTMIAEMPSVQCDSGARAPRDAGCAATARGTLRAFE